MGEILCIYCNQYFECGGPYSSFGICSPSCLTEAVACGDMCGHGIAQRPINCKECLVDRAYAKGYKAKIVVKDNSP